MSPLTCLSRSLKFNYAHLNERNDHLRAETGVWLHSEKHQFHLDDGQISNPKPPPASAVPVGAARPGSLDPAFHRR